MATGAAPALDPKMENKTKAEKTSETKPLSLKDRIVRKLTEIFQFNEDLGVTRQ